ncbi:MAG: amidohydrolase [Bacteroidetes bacterium]|nr:MAG: amidohydrolase [Bacteroidota bacterium]
MSRSLLLLFLLAGCVAGPEAPDLILHGGTIYTLDANQPQVEALAIRNGRVEVAGAEASLVPLAGPETQVIDLQGKTAIPGFVESHAHLMGLGHLQQQIDLSGARTYQDLIELVAARAATLPAGSWILGRGWHQSKWDPAPPFVHGFQTHEALSAATPDHPVFLEHASGHAAFANAEAMRLAGIGPDSRSESDGEVIRDDQGQPTGVFTEGAARLIEAHIPPPTEAEEEAAMQAAIQTALAHGITTFMDAGSGQAAIERFEEAALAGALDLRLWVMLAGWDSVLLDRWYQRGPLQSDYLTIRAIKLYADGALGSRGAWLLEDYTDRPGYAGQPSQPMPRIGEVARDALAHGFQVCTHAIGDRANREVLDQYEAAFADHPEVGDHRFRIEHAQHLHPDDIPRFAKLGVIASIQGIHMASDRPWAIDRLGHERIVSGAYVWQSLYQSGAHLINGTDAPVEPVDPIPCFYASVTRQTLGGDPPGGYEPEQAMSREQALRSYTLDAAYGGFLEESVGSLAPGKWADICVLSQDLLTVPADSILGTKVEMTFVGGVLKYQREK